MRDINVLEQRLSLHVPRVVLGGVIQGKAETKTVVPSPRLPVSPDFCSEVSEAAVSPYSQRSLHPTWAAPLPPYASHGRHVRCRARARNAKPIGYGVKSEILQNRYTVQKNKSASGEGDDLLRAKKNRVSPGRDRARPGPPGPLSKKARVSTPSGPMAGPAAGGPPERGPASRPQPAGRVFFGRRIGRRTIFFSVRYQ